MSKKATIKIGINGFGRIGRLVFRASLNRDDIEVVGVNDPFIDPEYMCYQFKYDTAQGTSKIKMTADKKNLLVNGRKIAVFQKKVPSELGWKDVGATIVAECSGAFTQVKECEGHLKAGAKKL
jgi:glyceraldehyde 3-phosphate dehydrogenase